MFVKNSRRFMRAIYHSKFRHGILQTETRMTAAGSEGDPLHLLSRSLQKLEPVSQHVFESAAVGVIQALNRFLLRVFDQFEQKISFLIRYFDIHNPPNTSLRRQTLRMTAIWLSHADHFRIHQLPEVCKRHSNRFLVRAGIKLNVTIARKRLVTVCR